MCFQTSVQEQRDRRESGGGDIIQALEPDVVHGLNNKGRIVVPIKKTSTCSHGELLLPSEIARVDVGGGAGGRCSGQRECWYKE